MATQMNCRAAKTAQVPQLHHTTQTEPTGAQV